MTLISDLSLTFIFPPNLTAPTDVIQDQEQSNKFFFYEIYTDLDAVKYHMAQPYFDAWTKFNESGGVISSVINKCDGLFMTD